MAPKVKAPIEAGVEVLVVEEEALQLVVDGDEEWWIPQQMKQRKVSVWAYLVDTVEVELGIWP